MKSTLKKMYGATLLEVMLVLAIAAMIIVMSIRYYQTAQNNQNANSVMEQIQAIVAAADQLSQGTGTYSTVTTANISALMPTKGMTSPWGTSIAMTSGTSTFSLSIPNTPAAICPLLASKLTANTHFTTVSSCGSSAQSFSFTYSSAN